MVDRSDSDPQQAQARRPNTGFAAWQATLGYISSHHSPDALLKLQVSPAKDGRALWSASISWGQHAETLADAASLADALAGLWSEVDRNHSIFLSSHDAFRRPVGYDEHDWLDVNTQDVLLRLIWTTQAVFQQDWLIVLIYQPTDTPVLRVQMRLLANKNTLRVGGRGPSILDATRDLFRNAAPALAVHSLITSEIARITSELPKADSDE